ncbi:hypothetical protein D1BOALGB6SA_2043 [Olavius sp. associated proteobacterium Delta 1]|nr:hypothetical protein D1BOALGB6SA_2043 [Olavius sp. associated proteobacterium Delta 1]
MQFPVISIDMHPVDSAVRGLVIDYNWPLNSGGVIVHPADIIFGDEDGVIGIPARAVRYVIIHAVEKAAGENETN